jgi:hypothetical protein
MILLAGLAFSCAGRAQAAAAPLEVRTFDDLQGREWILGEVVTPGGVISLDREKLTAQGFGDVFTLRFEGGRYSGTGAPNHFYGPYGEYEGSLTLSPAAGTLIAPLREPAELTEGDYLGLLQNASSWEVRRGRLELRTTGPAGEGVLLVFNLRPGI